MLSRRRFLQLLGLGALGAAGVAVAVPALRNRRPDATPGISSQGAPTTFTQHQYDTLVAAAAVIVPADDTPGASEAHVAVYLDAEAAKSPAFKQRYSEGLRWLDQASGRLYGGKPFVAIASDQQAALFREAERTQMARTRPTTSALDRAVRRVSSLWNDLFGLGGGASFFITLRDDVFEGFYTSNVAWQMLKYKGPPQPDGYPDYADSCPDNTGVMPTGQAKGAGLAAPAIRWFDIDLEFPYAFGSIPAQPERMRDEE